jgi:hypothetical protein
MAHLSCAIYEDCLVQQMAHLSCAIYEDCSVQQMAHLSCAIYEDSSVQQMASLELHSILRYCLVVWKQIIGNYEFSYTIIFTYDLQATEHTLTVV